MIINDLQNPGELRVYTTGLYRQGWTDAQYADPAAVAATGGTPDTETTNTNINAFNASKLIEQNGFTFHDWFRC